MRRYLFILLFLSATFGATAQLKPRPDAFPPKPETLDSKAITMATTVEEMADWDRYPTYDTYLEMMRRWVATYPTLCHVDTIGTSGHMAREATFVLPAVYAEKFSVLHL